MRVAIYARFSSDMQSKQSAEDQIRECHGYAQRQGWTVVLTERDEAVRAGATASREGYARINSAAQAASFDVLLVEEVSRFSRDFLGGMAELGALAKLKVRIADTRNGIIDLDSAQGQMMGAVTLMMAHQETKKLGERSKRGLKGKTIAGFSSGGKPAYGYKRVPMFSETERDVDGRPKRVGVRLEPDDTTAPIVARIFSMYASGESKGGIARALNEERVPSRDAGDVRQGETNNGTWATASIKKILENEIYVGERIWNKHSRTGDKLAGSGKKAMRPNPASEWITVPNYCTPIVDRATWDLVQARCASTHAEYVSKGNAENHRRYLLSGLIRCGECGGNYAIGSVFRGVRQYRCGMHATRGKVVCANKVCVPQPSLEQNIKSVLDGMNKDPAKLESLVSEHNARVRGFNDAQGGTVRRLEAQLAEARTALRNVIKAIEQGAGSLKALAATCGERERETEELEAKIAEAKSQLQPLLLPRPLAVADFLSGSASVFSGDYTADKAFLTRTLEKIVVHPDGSLVVHFRFDSLFGVMAAVGWQEGPEPEVPTPFQAHRYLATATASRLQARGKTEGGTVSDAAPASLSRVSVPSGI